MIYSKLLNSLIIIFILLLASCATEKTTIEDIKTPLDTKKEAQKSLAYPVYYGLPRKVMVFPWNISKVDLDKYPHFRNLQIGFGISNRLLDELFQSGQFELIEEKQAVISRMLQQMQQCTTGLCNNNYAPMQKLPSPTYIVYPEVYHVGVEKNVSIKGLSSEAKLTTEIGVQINFVDVKSGTTRSLGSAIGSHPNSQKSTILSNPKIDFSQSALGKAAEKAIKMALIKSIKNLPPESQKSSPPIRPDNSNNSATIAVTDLPGSITNIANRESPKDNSIIKAIKTAEKSSTKKDISTFMDKNNFHAFIIGNNQYQHVTKLETAVNDANEIASVLKNDYGFKTEVLIDATRQEIIAKFDSLRKKLKKKDKLLIYYAGHGYYDESADRGYWLPVNSTTDNTAEWISNIDITDKVRSIQAEHVIVISDSCYSGTLTRGLYIDLRPTETLSEYHYRMMTKPARTVMTSGGLEPVSDGGRGNHSVFAGAFLDSLKANKKAIDGMALFNQVKTQVTASAEQTPEYSDIKRAGHKGGDFIFIKR
ncbi:MAG: caspase family protein [Gammaproteobacteria bacterium]|nr:caspase family protein [Gammaproteobacteria bacterium]